MVDFHKDLDPEHHWGNQISSSQSVIILLVLPAPGATSHLCAFYCSYLPPVPSSPCVLLLTAPSCPRKSLLPSASGYASPGGQSGSGASLALSGCYTPGTSKRSPHVTGASRSGQSRRHCAWPHSRVWGYLDGLITCARRKNSDDWCGRLVWSPSVS